MPDHMNGSAFCREGEPKTARQLPDLPSWPGLSVLGLDDSVMGWASGDHSLATGIMY